MALVVQGLIVGPLVLCGLYIFLSLYCCRCLIWAHAISPRLSIRKVFVMNCLLTTLLRVMSFASIAVLAWLEYGNSDDDNVSATQDFYEKALVVLFDFPDFSIVSAYVLLFLVWCEAFVQARHHWLNMNNFQKTWILGYLVLNILLYSLQVALYSLLFFPSVNKEVLTKLIYLTLSGINLALPLVWLLVYMYLSLRFSGFPMASRFARGRLISLGRIGLLWTIARLFWGFVALTSVMDDWLFNVNESNQLYTIELVALFMLVEIIPISMALSRKNVHALDDSVSSDRHTGGSVSAALLSPQGYPGVRLSLDNVISNASADFSHQKCSRNNDGVFSEASKQNNGAVAESLVRLQNEDRFSDNDAFEAPDRLHSSSLQRQLNKDNKNASSSWYEYWLG